MGPGQVLQYARVVRWLQGRTGSPTGVLPFVRLSQGCGASDLRILNICFRMNTARCVRLVYSITRQQRKACTSMMSAISSAIWLYLPVVRISYDKKIYRTCTSDANKTLVFPVVCIAADLKYL